MLIGALGVSGPAAARPIHLSKQTVEQIKSACEKVGGKFSQDSNGYGCGTNCHGGTGTACIVFCTADAGCTAQVSGGGRTPHSVESALVRKKR